MQSLPDKLFYAVEAVLYIAYNAHSGPISSKEIAARQGLPPRYLEQLMQRLVRAGILRGVRGPRGGYLIARERRRITLADICGVLDEKDFAAAGRNTPLAERVVRPAWNRLSKGLREQMQAVTVADLCDEAVKQRVPRRNEERLDFAI